ncbi:unnamed protein product [Pedinophyceae sp. YPF-701]|nr:unnamed protein product [Pedinophyceae sp. YPF-701]
MSPKVTYFYDADIGNNYYGPGHPMKPHRIRMAHSLILHYGLYRDLEVFTPCRATEEDMMRFHSEEYIQFLKTVMPDDEISPEDRKKYGVGDDSPVFEGLFNYCSSYAGGSIGGAVRLNHEATELAVNWSGGLHHGKKGEASGFCYVNDIVLAIVELLKYHRRVLYIDIDIHHGDGVEEAFYLTDRVMCVSFHKYGDFFPGTGDVDEVGDGPGRYYSINVPLKEGMDDRSYEYVFKPVMQRVMDTYQPEAIVFQAGADSLSGDRLGCFNLSSAGHAECLRFMKTFGRPMLVLGGGGYTVKNVARCWAFETGVLMGREMGDRLPPNAYYEFYKPDYALQVHASQKFENRNTVPELDLIKTTLFRHLANVRPATSLGFAPRPEDAVAAADIQDNKAWADEQQDKNPDERPPLMPGGLPDEDDMEAPDDKPDRQDQAFGGGGAEAAAGQDTGMSIDT